MSQDVLNDPYLATAPYTVPGGENLLKWDPSGDGSFTVDRKEPEQRSNKWKDSKKIQSCSDDKISIIGIRESGIIDYRILDVSVSWRGPGNGEKRRYLCHTHVCNDCPHTRRIDRYRQERSAA